MFLSLQHHTPCKKCLLLCKRKLLKRSPVISKLLIARPRFNRIPDNFACLNQEIQYSVKSDEQEGTSKSRQDMNLKIAPQQEMTYTAKEQGEPKIENICTRLGCVFWQLLLDYY